MLKTDVGGNEEWRKTYGDGVPTNSSGSSVQQTVDGGFIVTGTSEREVDVGSVLLLKTNELGNI